MSTCPLKEEKSFSQRAFSIYTDIRKLQDKDKTSYTLGLAINNSLKEVHPGLVPDPYIKFCFRKQFNKYYGIHTQFRNAILYIK